MGRKYDVCYQSKDTLAHSAERIIYFYRLPQEYSIPKKKQKQKLSETNFKQNGKLKLRQFS